MKNINWCLADLIINFVRYVAMKQEINRIGMLVVLPLLLATIALYYIGEADAYESEENIFDTSIFPIELVSEEPSITPIIGIIGIIGVER